MEPTTPGESSCLRRMDALQRQSGKLQRQLSTLYQSLQNDFQLGVKVPVGGIGNGAQVLEKLREEEHLIRDEILSIWRKLPFRIGGDQPAEVCK